MRKEAAKPELIKKILKELRKNPRGIWVRKLARKLDEPPSTIYKYITRADYCGKRVSVERLERELGGHLMITLKAGK